MKIMTCECGHMESGSSENDVASKMQSHLHNEHADRVHDHKKMMHTAQKTLKDAVIA